ncbi:MAG: alanine--tRNA ligase [Bacilli bacterium]
MKNLTGAQIRRMWLDFFSSKGHMIEKGASLVPHNDPTLLWINSGVAALKKYFDGTEKPKSTRIVNAQKSIRTNDIENVGYTARHHTFFEMLGNFSIGDYFRKEAITWAWELLTSNKWFDFPIDKLYITVHPSDDESKKMWVSMGLPENHLVECEHNFWEIGEGPCGPNSEIFFDRGEEYDSQKIGIKLLAEDMENDRYIEIWNIVFSQYNSKEGLKREEYPELPQKNIDTGAGLERIACVMQEVETNFDTDLFMPIIREVETMTSKKYLSENKKYYRVIADHIRTCTFALADGALFSNEGRGYVLRRVLRRAVRYGKKLNIEGAFLYKLVPVVVKIMEDYYEYLNEKIDYIEKLIKIEEEKFEKTLSLGEQMLMDYLKVNINNKIINGETAFKLYDTYGFPYELTVEIAEEKGFKVDKQGFAKEMQKQKERARSAQVIAQSMNSQSKDLLEFDLKTSFDYNPTPILAKVIAIFKDGVKMAELEGEGIIVFDHTTFYAESGGQVYDTGILRASYGDIDVFNVQKAPRKQTLHYVNTNGINVKIGDEFELIVDIERRAKITRNHSAVHLLQKALQIVLGKHIEQAGSYVDDVRLRFDFTHFEKMSTKQIEEVELLVNKAIDKSYVADIKYMTLEDAKKTGAMALFSEKYEDIVRVVNFGGYSIELCGGCHVKNTGDIGVFVIDFEESISSGVRRIQATTGINAYYLMKNREQILASITNKLGALSYHEALDRFSSQMGQINDLKSQIEILKSKIALSSIDDMISNSKEQNGIKIIIEELENYDKEMMSKIVDLIKSKVDNYFVYLINKTEDKVSLLACSSKKAIEKGYNSGQIIKDTVKIIGGGGGGRPDMAQAGGKDSSKIGELVVYLNNYLNSF